MCTYLGYVLLIYIIVWCSVIRPPRKNPIRIKTNNFLAYTFTISLLKCNTKTNSNII